MTAATAIMTKSHFILSPAADPIGSGDVRWRCLWIRSVCRKGAKWRAGGHNKKTLAAARLLEGESEELTRKAVELALDGEPTAMRLCLKRILPPCRERAVKFALPSIESGAAIAPAMKAVAAVRADGIITPGEAEAIARIVDTFVRAIETSDFERRLKLLEREDAAQRDGAAWRGYSP